jgi:hypothetical protein
MKVLIAAQCGDDFDGALQFLETNTWAPNTNFKIIYVVELSDVTDLWLSMSGATRHREILSERHNFATHYLSEIEKSCREIVGVDAALESDVIIGRTSEAVIGTASEWEADIVVVGLPESTLVSRYAEALTFNHMVSKAPCPVTFARPRSRKRKAS